MPFRFNLLAGLLTFTGVAIADSYVIENINVIPMTEETVLEEHSVLVVDDKVAKICKRSRDCRLKETQRIKGKGKYLIPGLTDMHAHTDPGLLTQNSPRALADLARRVQQQQLRQYVAFGVTTIHDVAGGPTTLRIREDILAGNKLGPRIFSTKFVMDGDPRLHPVTTPFSDPQVAADYVRQSVAEGFDTIKVYSTLQKPVFDAIMDAAAESNTPVVGHVPMPIDMEYVLERGLRSIEHLSGFGMFCAGPEAGLKPTMDDVYQGLNYCTPAKVKAAAAMVARYPVWVDPTLIVQDKLVTEWVRSTQHETEEAKYTHPMHLASFDYLFAIFTPRARAELTASKQVRHALVKALSKAGVPLLIGTDTPASGYNVHQELALFVESGLTPYQALVAATAEPARYFEAKGEFGTIVEGASADMVMLDANPLEDIDNARKISGVMVRGKWLSSEDIASVRKRIQEEYAADRKNLPSLMPAQ